MKCTLSGDAASLVWSQTNPEQLTVEQLQELLRERYGSAKQVEKFQDELRKRQRRANEDLPTLRADISRLMSLPFPGDVSSMGQKMAIDYFLDSLNDSDFGLKIRESEPKNLNEAYTRVLRIEMIRKKVPKIELVEDAPVKHEKHTWAAEVDVSRSALNQRMMEEMQRSTQKRIEENQAENQKKIEEQLSTMALAQKTAQLQQTKIEERLAVMASEQNSAQLRQQMTLSDEVKM